MTEIPADYIRVHNHGFVGLVDHMGSDAAIVQAARVSYSKATTIKRSDIGLINYLMRKRHTSPFEMCEVKLHIRAPIFVLRQLVRHRTASLNEESGRYSVMEEEFFLPDSATVSGQNAVNKQMRGGEISLVAQASAPNLMLSSNKASFETYDTLLQNGVARELARTVLPLATYSSLYWKVDLHNLLHFLRLRLDAHAQQEIVNFAAAIRILVEPLFPVTFAAWENYVNQAVTFSKAEMDILRGFWFNPSTLTGAASGKMSDTEVQEFIAKLNPSKTM